MKKIVTTFLLLASLCMYAVAGYKVGDKAADFKLKNVNGKMVSLSDYKKAKGFVVIFTCNHCPFAKAYQNRIMAIDKKYKPLGYPVIAINPTDPKLIPADSYANMQKRAKEKGYTFPYLVDANQKVCREYGATNTPHVFLLQKDKTGDYIVRYIGTIDDNYQDPSAVKHKYLADAIDALLAGKKPDPSTTKAIGCSIKMEN